MRTGAECRRGKAFGEPYDGKRHVRFDEGTLETEQWARLRHRHVAKAAGQQSSLALPPPRQRPTLQTANVLKTPSINISERFEPLWRIVRDLPHSKHVFRPEAQKHNISATSFGSSR